MVDAVRDALEDLRGSAEVAALLQRVDERLAEESVGETTAVVILFSDGDILVCGTDGLFNYAGLEAVCDRARSTSLLALPSSLIDLVRLPSGACPDDVGISVARITVHASGGLGRSPP